MVYPFLSSSNDHVADRQETRPAPPHTVQPLAEYHPPQNRGDDEVRAHIDDANSRRAVRAGQGSGEQRPHCRIERKVEEEEGPADEKVDDLVGGGQGEQEGNVRREVRRERRGGSATGFGNVRDPPNIMRGNYVDMCETLLSKKKERGQE